MDWSELERVGRGPALIWLLTFFIVIVLLMLNMLLAIIFETYWREPQALRFPFGKSAREFSGTLWK